VNFQDKKSFLSLPNWFKEISDKVNADIYMILVGNKSDMAKERLLIKYLNKEKWVKKKVKVSLTSIKCLS